MTDLQWKDLAGARCAFTTLEEGNLALHVGDDPESVHRRRADLARSAGSAPFVFMNQTHSDAVMVLDEHPEDASGERDPRSVDALVSADVPLGVLVADCLPVLFAVSGGPGRPPLALGAAHAGRAGVLNGILPSTVAMLRQKAGVGSEAQILAVIGPAVCGECYEVPEEMAAAAEAASPGIRTRTRWGTPGLDLKAAARRQLEALGVVVADEGVCTMESERHSSHRRDPSSGRIAGLIFTPSAEKESVHV